MHINNILIALLLGSSVVYAQDFKERIKSLRNDYEQSKSLQVIMEIYAYENGESGQPYYHQTVDVKRDGDNYLYQIDENEMLLNEKYLIMVDNSMRQINCVTRSVEDEKELRKGLQFNLDSALANCDRSKYLGIEDSTEHFVVPEKNGPIEEIHFYFSPENNKLKKIAYKYSEGQYVTIDFNIFEKNAVFEKDTFSEARYFKNENKKLIPSGYFKDYIINDQ